MKVAYYPGCTAKSFAKNFEITAIEVAKRLGVELVELSRWNCCGTVFSLDEENLIKKLGPLRNLIRTKEDGFDKVVSICQMCNNTLRQVGQFFERHPDKVDPINEFMYKEDMEYDGSVQALHYLEMLRDMVGFDRIREEVSRPLAGLKVAAYYGCTLVRPEAACVDPNPEKPTILDELLIALGATPIYDPNNIECCGSYQTVHESQKSIVINRTNKIVSSMRDSGADLIITSCPLCLFNLDRRQKETKEAFPGFHGVPVVYFTQLMAIAFGIDPKKIGCEEHFADPLPVLKKLLAPATKTKALAAD